MSCICTQPVTSTMKWRTIVENLVHVKENLYLCPCGKYHRINFRSGPPKNLSEALKHALEEVVVAHTQRENAVLMEDLDDNTFRLDDAIRDLHRLCIEYKILGVEKWGE